MRDTSFGGSGVLGSHLSVSNTHGVEGVPFICSECCKPKLTEEICRRAKFQGFRIRVNGCFRASEKRPKVRTIIDIWETANLPVHELHLAVKAIIAVYVTVTPNYTVLGTHTYD